MSLPGATPYTKGSEIENAETSAWGRAIGSLGIGIENSIASADEVRAKEVRADVEHGDDGSLIGVVQVGDKASSDFLLRQTPDGSALGFRLRGDRGGILVKAFGTLANQLFDNRDAVIGKRVTVWGRVGDETFTPAKPANAKPVTYQVLTAERVSVPGIAPMPYDATPEPSAAPGPDLAGSEPPEDVPLLSEAPSAALFDELEEIGA